MRAYASVIDDPVRFHRDGNDEALGTEWTPVSFDRESIGLPRIGAIKCGKHVGMQMRGGRTCSGKRYSTRARKHHSRSTRFCAICPVRKLMSRSRKCETERRVASPRACSSIWKQWIRLFADIYADKLSYRTLNQHLYEILRGCVNLCEISTVIFIIFDGKAKFLLNTCL